MDLEAPVADVNQQPAVLQQQLKSFEQSGSVMQSRLASVQLTGGELKLPRDLRTQLNADLTDMPIQADGAPSHLMGSRWTTTPT